MKLENYLLVCSDHDDVVIEFWKYDNIDDTEHAHCNTRSSTPAELIEYLQDPEEQNCINEEFVFRPQTTRSENLRFLADMVDGKL
jgi:hypothetical protein